MSDDHYIAIGLKEIAENINPTSAAKMYGCIEQLLAEACGEGSLTTEMKFTNNWREYVLQQKELYSKAPK